MATATQPKRKRGRPVEVVEKVFETTHNLLMTVPIQSLTFELIAERADIHKTTLYRRWTNVPNLITEVLNWISSERIPMPDTGSLEGDIRELVSLYGAHFRSDLGKTINRILIDHQHTKIEGVSDWMEAHFQSQHAAFTQVASRSLERGEIQSVEDFIFAIELVLGPMLMRSSLNGIAFDESTEQIWSTIALNYLATTPAGTKERTKRFKR